MLVLFEKMKANRIERNELGELRTKSKFARLNCDTSRYRKQEHRCVEMFAEDQRNGRLIDRQSDSVPRGGVENFETFKNELLDLF